MSTPSSNVQATATQLRGAIRFLLDWLAYPYQSQLLALSGERLERGLKLEEETAWCLRLTSGLERVVAHLDQVADRGERS